MAIVYDVIYDNDDYTMLIMMPVRILIVIMSSEVYDDIDNKMKDCDSGMLLDVYGDELILKITNLRLMMNLTMMTYVY